MNIQLKTFYGDDKKASCLICNTTHYNGNKEWLKEGCSCGNISFFDITPDYVRFSVNWPLVYVDSADEWKDAILFQITNNGEPLKYQNLSSGNISSMNLDDYLDKN
tara:strand:+ start:432 stop:749 length:318 start_codon:yes stop_codon:yes gene_type:complete